MNKKEAKRLIIAHFKNGDRYNQLRPGETTLAIECFIQGFTAMLGLTESLKLTEADFEDVVEEVEQYFEQFVDSKTTTREVA